jgi:hypothetical protein
MQPLRRSTRDRKLSCAYFESLPGTYPVAYEALATYDQEWAEHTICSDPTAFAATADPDSMYLDQALREPDAKKFIEAMQNEIQAHTDNRQWEIVPRASVPKSIKVLRTVWAMKRKRRIATQEVYKWKARLNVDGRNYLLA